MVPILDGPATALDQLYLTLRPEPLEKARGVSQGIIARKLLVVENLQERHFTAAMASHT
jgi:hypothetical protein